MTLSCSPTNSECAKILSDFFCQYLSFCIFLSTTTQQVFQKAGGSISDLQHVFLMNNIWTSFWVLVCQLSSLETCILAWLIQVHACQEVSPNLCIIIPLSPLMSLICWFAVDHIDRMKIEGIIFFIYILEHYQSHKSSFFGYCLLCFGKISL